MLSFVVLALPLLSLLARAEEGVREVRLSPDGDYCVGWYDHDGGKPFGIVRSVVVRSVFDPYDIFSLVSVPRWTEAEWNSASTMCVVADAPDNGGPNTWLVHRNNRNEWASVKLDPFDGLFAEFCKAPRGSALFRPSILKISWVSETTVRFHAYCNLGTYLITIDTTGRDKKPVSKKLSDRLLEPKDGQKAASSDGGKPTN